MKQEDISSTLLLAGLFLSPWLAGSTAVWKGGVSALAFLLILASVLDFRTWKSFFTTLHKPIPPWCKIVIIGGLAFLLWWAAQPSPEFSSAFTKRQISILSAAGNKILQQPLPRLQTLFYLGTLLLALPVVARLSKRQRFRTCAALILSGNAVLMSAYAYLSAHLSAPALPWIGIPDSISRFSSPFFVYSGVATAVTAGVLALVSFLDFSNARTRTFAVPIGILIIVCIVAYRYWPASSLFVIAGALLAVYAALRWTRPSFVPQFWLQLAVLTGIFAITAGQAYLALKTDARSGQNWISPQVTQLNMPARDVRMEERVSKRGDRMAPSLSPNRPMVWMAGLRMTLDNPLIGHGPGTWTRQAALYSNDPLVLSFALCLLFTHHDALQATAEWGLLPGLCLISIWLIALWRQWGRARKSEPQELAWAVILLGLTLSSCLHWPMQIPALQYLALIVVGISLGPRQSNA